MSVPEIPTRLHPSGFDQADSNFYALSGCSDGRIYYVLSSHNIDTHGRCYRYDPSTDAVELAFDLGEACGESGAKALPQGKSHSRLLELDGTIYLATHYGYFATTGGKEQPATVPDGYRPYPGGHVLSYDMATGAVTDLARAPDEEGLLTLAADADRGRLYAITWPSGLFMTYDIARRELRSLGPVSRGGECGTGDQYFCLVRSLAVHPADGSVYFTNSDGEVLRYDLDADAIASVDGLSMKRDLFGQWDPHQPGHQGYNWRDIFWHEAGRRFYGVHPKSGWLIAFDPAATSIELIDRICTDDLRRSGGFEPFRYGYLTLRLAADGETIYYLTSDYGLTAEDGRTVRETTHPVTYNLRTGDYADHGRLRLADGRYPRMSHSLDVGPDGRWYAAPWIEKPDRDEATDRVVWQCDLVSFESPM